MIATEMIAPAAPLDLPSETAGLMSDLLTQESTHKFMCRHCCHTRGSRRLPPPERDLCAHVWIDADRMMSEVATRIVAAGHRLVDRVKAAPEAEYAEVSRVWLAEMDVVVDEIIDRYGERLGKAAHRVVVGRLLDGIQALIDQDVEAPHV